MDLLPAIIMEWIYINQAQALYNIYPTRNAESYLP